MNIYHRLSLSLFILLLLTACSGQATLPSPLATPDLAFVPTEVPITPTATPVTPTKVTDYLNEALDIMEEHSINRHNIEWESFRAEAHAQAVDAQTPAEVYDVIRARLQALRDNHSFFMTPAEYRQIFESSGNDYQPDPSGMLLDNGIGYIYMPGFSGGPQKASIFATTMQGAIRELDAAGVCGWIVDLRENTGGNMWPMLAGIGPVLGEGLLGSFIDPVGRQQPWFYEDGQAFIGDFPLGEVNGEPYELTNPDPPVAVLTAYATASSGEAVTVAFRERPNTRSFGTSTYGISTANNGFELSDGAQIFLTVSTFVDRAGNLYGKHIAPDERITNEQATMEAATDWLLAQTACEN